MIGQWLFLVGLHLVGCLLFLPLRPKIPLAFISLTGFLWGSVAWVLMSLIALLTVGFSPILVLLFLGILLGIVWWIAWGGSNVQLQRTDGFGILAGLILIGILAIVFINGNRAIATVDSFSNIAIGRAIIRDGFLPQYRTFLSTSGIFLPILQGTSVFMGDAYLWAFQPLLTVTGLCALGIILLYQLLQSFGNSRWLSLTIMLGALLFVGTTYHAIYQAYNIHSNALASIYLPLAMACFYIGLNRQAVTWMLLGMVALVAFSFARPEGIIFSLPLLVLILSQQRFSYHQHRNLFLPYVAIVGAWSVCLLIFSSSASRLLNAGTLYLILGALAGITLLLFAPKWTIVQQRLIPYLPQLMLLGVVFTLVGLTIWKPQSASTIINTIKNMYVQDTSLWGVTWMVMVAVFVASFTLPALPHSALFRYGLPILWLLTLVISFVRADPYYVAWFDSGNRMLTHVYLAFIFYLLLTLAYRHQATRD